MVCTSTVTKCGGAGLVRTLLGSLLFFVLLGWRVVLSAPEDKKNHEALVNTACVDCHKQTVSPNVRCLIVKENWCALCHDIPAAGGPARLTEASRSVCFRCHPQKEFKGNFLHGPFAAAACVTCHDPHGGNAPSMLRTAGRQLCTTCHRDVDARLTNSRFRHRGTANGCTDCHSPHSSDQRYQLRAAVPELCARCHERILSELRTAAVKHSPSTEPPACLNCHDPHASDNERLLFADGMDVCLKCHEQPVKAGLHELAPVGQILSENPEHHGPIQSRNCSTCHSPHGSSHFRLLVDAYPKDFYVPFFESTYNLCFRCHESTLVKEQHTTTGTGFRDGDRNLHFVHVKEPSRGRTCRACHEVHASTLPKHMATTVPFGNWGLPLKFSKTENGGGCEPGCHGPAKYDREAAQSR